jgi:putative spermidine/putrescine transport system permease protein
MRRSSFLFNVVCVLVLGFLILPIVIIALLSFSSASYLTFPPPSLGLRWYHAYFSSQDWLDSTWLSLFIALCVVVHATVLGTSAALGLNRLTPIVVAIGLYYVFARYRLVGTASGLVLAHTCLAVPFVVTSVSASLASLDRQLERAALSLGATPFGTFRQVTLPLILPGVLAGALFAFIVSFDELIVALFLSGTGAITLPRRMWDDLRFAIDPTIAAVSTLTIVLTAALLAGARLARRS